MSVTISKEVAKRLYADSPEWFKNELENEFGKETFIPKDYETIRTFDDACTKLGIDPETVFSSSDTLDEIAYKKLKVVAKAINNGWVPNWNNGDEYKYSPWFNLSSGFGFSHSRYGCDHSRTTVGSRLCTDTREKALYIADQFKQEYKEYLLYSE